MDVETQPAQMTAVEDGEPHDTGTNDAEPGADSLFARYQTCQVLFRNLVLCITGNDYAVIDSGQLDVQKLLDEYGRFKIFGVESRATLLPVARGSLDHTLRHSKEISDNVSAIFTQMGELLEYAIHVLQTRSGNDGEAHDSGSDSHSDSSDSSDDESAEPEIVALTSQMFEQIKLLYRLSALLRRPGLTGRYLKSSNWPNERSILFDFDYTHVQHKIWQWNRQGVGMSAKDSEPVDDEVAADRENGPNVIQAVEGLEVSPEMLSERQAAVSPKDPLNILSERLGQANTRRREQIRYWERRPLSETERLKLPEVHEPTSMNVAVHGVRGRARTKDEKRPADSRSILSTPTVHSFSTVARSAIMETPSVGGRPRTVYAQSNPGMTSKVGVPPVPRECETNAQFECPYCHTMLESASMQDRNAWKRHVFRDLRPYMCTFAKCFNGDKMYATRHEWIYHEMQMHRRQWKCEKCCQTFDSEGAIAGHFNHEHSGFFEQRQLMIMLEMSERPMDDAAPAECPLCPAQDSLGRLMDHLAQHLEEISLFALPLQNDMVERRC